MKTVTHLKKTTLKLITVSAFCSPLLFLSGAVVAQPIPPETKVEPEVKTESQIEKLEREKLERGQEIKPTPEQAIQGYLRTGFVPSGPGNPNAPRRSPIQRLEPVYPSNAAPTPPVTSDLRTARIEYGSARDYLSRLQGELSKLAGKPSRSPWENERMTTLDIRIKTEAMPRVQIAEAALRAIDPTVK